MCDRNDVIWQKSRMSYIIVRESVFLRYRVTRGRISAMSCTVLFAIDCLSSLFRYNKSASSTDNLIIEIARIAPLGKIEKNLPIRGHENLKIETFPTFKWVNIIVSVDTTSVTIAIVVKFAPRQLLSS